MRTAEAQNFENFWSIDTKKIKIYAILLKDTDFQFVAHNNPKWIANVSQSFFGEKESHDHAEFSTGVFQKKAWK